MIQVWGRDLVQWCITWNPTVILFVAWCGHGLFSHTLWQDIQRELLLFIFSSFCQLQPLFFIPKQLPQWPPSPLLLPHADSTMSMTPTMTQTMICLIYPVTLSHQWCLRKPESSLSATQMTTMMLLSPGFLKTEICTITTTMETAFRPMVLLPSYASTYWIRLPHLAWHRFQRNCSQKELCSKNGGAYNVTWYAAPLCTSWARKPLQVRVTISCHLMANSRGYQGWYWLTEKNRMHVSGPSIRALLLQTLLLSLTLGQCQMKCKCIHSLFIFEIVCTNMHANVHLCSGSENNIGSTPGVV